MNSPKEIHNQLIDLLMLFRVIHPTHLTYLLRFSQHPSENYFRDDLLACLQKIQTEQLIQLIQISMQKLTPEQTNQALVNIVGNPSVLPKDGIVSLRTTVSLHQLQMLLQSLSEAHIAILFDILPPLPPNGLATVNQQQNILTQLQKILSVIMENTLIGLREELKTLHPSKHIEHLRSILQLDTTAYHLYEPLAKLFQMDINELIRLQKILPKLIPMQLFHIIKLVQMDPSDALELKKLIVPNEPQAQFTLTEEQDLFGLNFDSSEKGEKDYDFRNFMDEEEEATEGGPRNFNVQDSMTDAGDADEPEFPVVESAVTIRLAEQPAERCVYKRNLKPAPKVVLEGDDKNHPKLFVAAKLVRCDTLEEMEDKFLSGPKVLVASLGVSSTFKRLKVMTTSHQQGETHFCLKFELREPQGDSDDDYVVLHTIQSNPFTIVSHSTQLKGPPAVIPLVTDVIPCKGSTQGGTKVVVLGCDFVESPGLRIKFDETTVIPVFHGPKTLICKTPSHTPSTVKVRVSNDNKNFSETSSAFTFEDQDETSEEDTPEAGEQANEMNDFEGIELLDGQVFENASLDLDKYLSEFGGGEFHFEGGFGNDLSNNLKLNAKAIVNHIPEGRQYSFLQFACASEHLETVDVLLKHGAELNFRDKKGNSALFYSVLCGKTETVKHLLNRVSRRYSLNVNSLNNEGFSALFAAVAVGNVELASLLLSHGANTNVKSVRDGTTPLHLAASMGSLEMLSLLLSHGAFLNSRDHEGETPIFHSVRNSHFQAVHLLVQRGAEVTCTNIDKENLLHFACASANQKERNVQAQILRLLLSKLPKSFSIQDNLGFSPLHLSILADEEEELSIFLSHFGRDILHQRTSFGDNAISLAASFNPHLLHIMQQKEEGKTAKPQPFFSSSFSFNFSPSGNPPINNQPPNMIGVNIAY